MGKRRAPIPVYFTSLEIENVRCFGETQPLDLTADGRPARWTLILGENGVGKTTLLQCLAWMRLVPESGFQTGPREVGDESGQPAPLTKGKLGPALPDAENEILESLLRLGPGAELTLGAKLSFGGKLSATGESARNAAGKGKPIGTGVRLLFDAKRQLSEFKYLRRPKVEALGGEFHEPLIVVYGANRQRGLHNLTSGDLDDPASASRLSRVTELYDIEEMLSSLDYASRRRKKGGREKRILDRLLEILAIILPGNSQASHIEIHPPDVLARVWTPSEVRFKTFSGLVPMSALSLGYQTTLAWTADLAWRLMKRFPLSPNPLAEPAVVLIDEIDLHLHPPLAAHDH